MKLFKFFLLSAIFIFFSSPFARAVTVKPLNLQQLTRMAPRIVQVTLEDKQVEYDDEESGRLVVYYTFKVNECIKGTCSDHLTIKQIAQGTSAGGPVTARINLGLPEYDGGKTYLLFLANDSPRTGMTAPMGVFQGHFPMEKQEGKWVVPGLHTRAILFRNMEERLPAKSSTIRKLSSEGSADDYEEFKSVINAILEK